jgi:ppGpp synthetase/RelA/SpoT-type nucleotidyltranferase
MSADMKDWDSQIVERFKTLLNVSDISGDVHEEGASGEGDEAKLKRAAIARNSNPLYVQLAHKNLTALAFGDYQEWCTYEDDDWTTECLGQILDEDQNAVLLKALRGAAPLDLADAVERMAGTYAKAWQQAADNVARSTEAAKHEATEYETYQADDTTTASGLVAAENVERWKYSRTPGTRYYIVHDGEYLYSDDKNAPLAGWATDEARDAQAAARVTEWETGSGIFYTSYENPAHVNNVSYVFGESRYGPWSLDQSQAADLLADKDRQARAGVAGQGSSIEPYFDTGYFTKYQSDTYYFGETAGTTTWYSSYQELLDALTARTTLAGRQQNAMKSGTGVTEKIVKSARKGTQDEVQQMCESWSELGGVLTNPVTMKSLVKQPEAIKMLDVALQDIQARLTNAGITDMEGLRSGEMTLEVQAVIDDMKGKYPNEVFDHGMVAVSAKIVQKIKGNPSPDGYKQRGFNLEQAKGDTEYQKDYVRKLLETAPLAQAELTKIAKEYAEKYGGEASWRETPKEFTRAMAKVGEYQGDASMLVDVVGARVRFPRLASIYKALDDLESDRRLEIVRIKDRIAEATPSGNRSILMNVQVKDAWGGGGEGQIAELKFGLTAYDEIAAVDHPLYEIRRDMEDIARQQNRKLSPVESLIKAATEVQGRQRSELVWNRVTAGNDLHERLVDNPDVAMIGELLLTDSAKHPTNIANRLADRKTRDVTIKHISELAQANELKIPGEPKKNWRTLTDYSFSRLPGEGPLFKPVDPSINKTANGQDRAAAFQIEAKKNDPVRNVGSPASDEDKGRLAEYATWLREVVEPEVEREVRKLADLVDGAEVNVRTKSAEGILDKVERMTTNLPGRPARPGYRAGDVIDAVGARITTPGTKGLERILELVQQQFGTGDGGRILEIDNMYAAPKPKNPGYRVIPLVVKGQDPDGRAYTFELQLTTLRASIAADIEHNTLFKPYIDLKSVPANITGGISTHAETISWMMHEAAALDQKETTL